MSKFLRSIKGEIEEEKKLENTAIKEEEQLKEILKDNAPLLTKNDIKKHELKDIPEAKISEALKVEQVISKTEGKLRQKEKELNDVAEQINKVVNDTTESLDYDLYKERKNKKYIRLINSLNKEIKQMSKLKDKIAKKQANIKQIYDKKHEKTTPQKANE